MKEAQALHDAGNKVTVIATRTLAQVDCRDDAVLTTAHWQSQRLDFRTRNGWRLRRAIQTCFALGFVISRGMAFSNRAVSAFAGPLIAAAKRVPADLYIAHYPPALPAAASAAHKHRAIYAYDAEDFHVGEWVEQPTPIDERQRRTVRATEERYLPGCAYVTAASPGIAEAYVQTYKIPCPTVVLNAFPRANAPSDPTPSGIATPGPSIYWYSQTIGPRRGLECAVMAIARARTRPHLYLRGTPASGYLALLQNIAAAAGIADRLHILSPAAPHEMEKLAAVFDLGLSAEPGCTPNNRIALGNKLFTYVLAGIPLVISDTAAHRAFAVELGGAALLYAADDPDNLANVFDKFLGDAAFLAAARAEAYRLGQTRFNWDVEKAVLLQATAITRDAHKGNLS